MLIYSQETIVKIPDKNSTMPQTVGVAVIYHVLYIVEWVTIESNIKYTIVRHL